MPGRVCETGGMRLPFRGLSLLRRGAPDHVRERAGGGGRVVDDVLRREAAELVGAASRRVDEDGGPVVAELGDGLTDVGAISRLVRA